MGVLGYCALWVVGTVAYAIMDAALASDTPYPVFLAIFVIGYGAAGMIINWPGRR